MTKEQINEITTPTTIGEKGKQGRKPEALYFPRDSLQESLKVAQAIWEYNAGNPFSLLDLSGKLNCSVTSSTYAELLRSSQRYGLTVGSWNFDASKTISMTDLASSIIAPTNSDDVNANMRKALESPRIFKGIFDSLNGKIIPPEDVLKNTLIRNYHLSKVDSEYAYKSIIKNIQELNLIQEDGKGKKFLNMNKLSSAQQIVTAQEIDTEQNLTPSEVESSTPTSSPKIEEKVIPKQIFVAHGKNIKSLEQLKSILDQFQIPYKVAIDEPNEGRPVSKKVSDLMHGCSSAIFIFTKDEETKTLEGKTIYRPSDNVVFELGAASVLYGNKIVIFKENGVSFGSDFKDLGYISFDTDQLGAKSMELMKELIGFGLLKISAA